MNKKSISILLLTVPLFFVVFGIAPAKEDEGDTYWYVNGDKYYWHYQPDVFAFRQVNGEAWQGMLDTACVKYIFHRGMHGDKMNVLYFKNECSERERATIKNTIRASVHFEAEFPVITLFPEQPYNAKAWFVIDDMLLVNFEPDSLTRSTFNAFKQKYGLEQINFPDSVFPEGIVTYVFHTNSGIGEDNAIDKARTIFTQSRGLVKNVQPNLIYAYEETSDENMNLLNTGGTGIHPSGITYYIVNTSPQLVKLFIDFKIANPQGVIRIYDVFGREMLAQEVQQQKEHVDVHTADYTSGIYFVSIENKRGEPVIVEKFLKF